MNYNQKYYDLAKYRNYIVVLYNTIIFKIPIINLYVTYWIHKNLHKLLSGFNFMKFFLYLFLAFKCTHNIFLYICKIIIFFSSSWRCNFLNVAGEAQKKFWFLDHRILMIFSQKESTKYIISCLSLTIISLTRR